MAVKIDFLVPGFSKCGTTTLCKLLAGHPDIFMPGLKEPWYFSAEDFEARTEGYIRLFARAEAQQLRGEGSSSYSSYSTEDISISRIKRVNPDCKFLFIVRNPWQRIESAYREMHNSGLRYGLHPPFAMADCLREFPQIVRDTCYWQRIAKYLDNFPAHCIKVLFLDELEDDPQGQLAACFRHLGVDDNFQIKAGAQLNPGHSKLYDSRLLRRSRSLPGLGAALATISPKTQDRWFAKIGLRKPFGEQIPWDEKSVAIVQETILPDSEKFLAHFGKAPNFWAQSPPSVHQT